jgi:quinolinate synthase
MAICAHFYMDVELQGVLQALPDQSKVFIGDSLAMGDAAVRMCEEGAEAVAVLGVDFMSESVRSIVDKAGYGHVPVFRATEKKIG